MECTLCPRNCRAARTDTAHLGFCKSTDTAVVTRAAPHFWEEPCISGQRGSGTVFFAGCNLGCIYCQNAAISRNGLQGRAVDVPGLRRIFASLQAQGVHNINLVTPTHFASQIGRALEQPPAIPVVYNCGGYESVDTLRQLEGKIQIYLPDMKYMDRQAAADYSGAPDYPERACAAIEEMFRQVGPCRFDKDGILQRGVLIRHLILPAHTRNTLAVIDWVSRTFPKGAVLFSLMSQYTPTAAVSSHPVLHRPITRREYEKCRDALFAAGMEEGYVQELSSARELYIPAFDGTGLDAAAEKSPNPLDNSPV